MNTFEIAIISIVIVALFFINRFMSKKYLSRVDPNKLEAVRLILFALLLGLFSYTILSKEITLKDTRYLLQVILTVVLALYFGYRSYKWIKRLNAKEV